MNGKVLIIAEDAKSLILTRKELIEAIIRRGCQCDVLVPQDKYCSILEDMGCSIVDISFERRSINPIGELKLIRKYIKHLSKNKYDFVITYSIKPNIYGGLACCLSKTPYYINITGMGSALNGKGVVKHIVKALYRLVAPRANGVFFENEGNKDAFIRWKLSKESNSHVFHGAGINLSAFEYSPADSDNETVTFLYVGRLMEEKGVVELCNAAKKIGEKYPNTIFEFAGDFEDTFEKTFNDEYKGIKNIKYLGYRDDIKECIRRCDCVVLPSYHEGMANALLEGGAIGRPLLASNIYGCREAIVEGKNGFVFEPHDENSLYEAIEKFLKFSSTEREMFGKESRKHIEEYFDRQKIVEEIIKIVF